MKVTLKVKDIEHLLKTVKTPNEKLRLKEALEYLRRGWVVVRRDITTHEIEVIPTSALRHEMNTRGMNIPVRSFKIKV